jgi:hypothetical protein
MKHTLALSMIPVAIAWAAHTPVPVSKGGFRGEEIKPISTPVQIENITARRMDEGSFRARWSAAAQLPPTIEVHYVTDHVVDAGAVAEAPAAPPSRHTVQTVQTIRRVALRSDICSRHGMRRVNYGKRWRCRR